MDYQPAIENKRKKTRLVVIAVVILLGVVLALPPVWSRVSYHSLEVYRTVKYWINPPSEAVFVPSTHNEQTGTPNASAAIAAASPTPQPTQEPTALPSEAAPETEFTPTSTLPPTATATPLPTPVPLPSSALLTGILCERQFMNNCGPATLSMYLSYYDWGKNQIAAAEVLKPNAKDVNVMPYEVADFVNEHTEQRALWRYGADLQTIKRLVAAGLPVMIEKSFEPYTMKNDGWMGHYNLVVGYDDGRETLTVHDSYLLSYAPWGGEIPVDQFDTFIGFDFYYSKLEQDWRSFNFVIIVVYPPEREDEVLSLLGPLAAEKDACRSAHERAMQETASLTDPRERYFAWFNAGTSLVCLEDYEAAATAFDAAFEIYPEIPEASRPYRMLWYAEGPYAAYYSMGRYQDIINLANQVLGHMAEPVLEESYYWRALSYLELGDTNKAVEELRTSLKYHPGFRPSLAMLEKLGKTP